MTGAEKVNCKAVLTYNGNWISVSESLCEREKVPKGFTVKAQSGEALWSGCIGVGMERWASAFLSQMGLDPAGWPEAFSKRFGEMPKRIRFL
jgi:seryl-tRNA synthetase